MHRKRVMQSAACLCAASVLATAAGAAEVYPNRPVRIVTTDIGNSNDLLARLLAESLTGPLGQQVIVENRGGSGGGMAVDRLKTATPDGHTIMVHGTSIWLLPLMRHDTPWDPFRDFAPVSLIARNPAVLVVPVSLPPKTVGELIDYAKTRPGQLNYVSVDDGSPSHLAAELFASMAGVKIVRIAYRGGGAAFNGLLAGEGHMMVNAVAPAMVHVRAGRLRALGVTSASAMLPEIPTIGATITGYEWITHQVVLAPAKTPAPILKRLNSETVRALGRADLKEKAMKMGIELRSSPAMDVTAMMKTETARMRPVIQNSGITMQ